MTQQEQTTTEDVRYEYAVQVGLANEVLYAKKMDERSIFTLPNSTDADWFDCYECAQRFADTVYECHVTLMPVRIVRRRVIEPEAVTEWRK